MRGARRIRAVAIWNGINCRARQPPLPHAVTHDHDEHQRETSEVREDAPPHLRQLVRQQLL